MKLSASRAADIPPSSRCVRVDPRRQMTDQLLGGIELHPVRPLTPSDAQMSPHRLESADRLFIIGSAILLGQDEERWQIELRQAPRGIQTHAQHDLVKARGERAQTELVAQDERLQRGTFGEHLLADRTRQACVTFGAAESDSLLRAHARLQFVAWK